MSRTHTANGKRLSSMAHAKYDHECEFCETRSAGNGGKVAHARSHVRSGEAVELVKFYAGKPNRVFVAADDADRIAYFADQGYDAPRWPEVR